VNSRLREGKKILEQALNCRIRAFVAPNEYAPSNLISEVRGLYEIYCGHVPYYTPSYAARIIAKYLPFMGFGKIGLQKAAAKVVPVHLIPSFFLSPVILERKGLRWYFKSFVDLFERTRSLRGYFMLVVHHYDFTQWTGDIVNTELKHLLDLIIDYVVANPFVWRASICDLADWLAPS
jgi:hypothetical protein